IAAHRRDDAGSHRSAKPEGIAHCDHPFPSLGEVVSKCDEWKRVLPFDLEKGKIGLWICANHLCVEHRTIILHNLQLDGVGDDVVVGDNVALGADEEPRTLGLNVTMTKALALLSLARRAELPEEGLKGCSLEGICAPIARCDLRGHMGFDADRNHGGLHRLHEIYKIRDGGSLSCSVRGEVVGTGTRRGLRA